MDTKKMGRPKSTNPRSEVITIKLTQNERKFLDECCEKEEMVRRDLIMKCIYKAYK